MTYVTVIRNPYVREIGRTDTRTYSAALQAARDAWAQHPDGSSFNIFAARKDGTLDPDRLLAWGWRRGNRQIIIGFEAGLRSKADIEVTA